MTCLSRRRVVMLTSAALAGCSVLPTRPYQERREWPLDITPPVAPGGPGRKVLLVRALRAGPGMDTRGLRTIQPDGAERIANWEEWAVPPPQGVEEDLRQWLAARGLYAAVTMPGSTLKADLVLEGELLALAADLQSGTARAVVAVVLQAQAGNRPLLQRSFVGTAKLQGQDGPAQAAAMRAAIADMLGQITAALEVYAWGRNTSFKRSRYFLTFLTQTKWPC